MVRVCDCIMGTGKSSAAITYLNEHADQKFIYITPYLEEAERIKNGCPSLHFVEPSDKLKEYQYKKSVHTAALIEQGRNIATTHQAFRGYTAETLENIKKYGYVLIIDENVEVLESFAIHPDDLKIAVDAGYIREDDGVYSIVNTEYHGMALRELFQMMRSRELVRIADKGTGDLFYWALPPELITSFQDVFILTYLFRGQSLHHFLEIYKIPYEFVGIQKDEDGTFRFGELPGYTPDYVHHLGDMIHILESPKLNEVGDDYYALSKTWFERSGGSVDQLKRNVINCFRNIWEDIPVEQRLWGTFKSAFNMIRGKGYTKRFLTFNAKATNKYKDCKALVYIVNVFMNVNEKKFYQMHGIEVNEDEYALSCMVQWIWRSAIRDGNQVELYIPSSRMRGILKDWILSFDEGGETE